MNSHHILEQEACDKYGVKQVYFIVWSREAPSREQVLGAKQLFEDLEYPAMMHCKSGADRAGVMSVLYMHFRKGLPISEAIRQLDLKFGHVRAGLTGVLDYCFEKYIEEVEPLGVSFEDWVKSPAYDPAPDQARLPRPVVGHAALGEAAAAGVAETGYRSLRSRRDAPSPWLRRPANRSRVRVSQRRH